MWRWSAVVAMLLGACAAPAAPRSGGRAATRLVTSNVLRGDYAGSDECKYCHRAIYDAWAGSPMRNMTREIGGAEVRAPFGGETFHLGDDSATMTQGGGQRVVRLASPVRGTHAFRVTRVIGGRTREDFAGVELDDAGADVGAGLEEVLPVTWVYGTETWRYKGYSVMLPERPGMMAGPVWARTCIGCHNTLPALALLYDDLLGPGAPGYIGSVDQRLPADRAWSLRVTDAAGLARAVEEEAAQVGGAHGATLPEVLKGAILATRNRLDRRQLVETGIGCETCHGGARQHADDPKARPSFEPRSPFFVAEPAGAGKARWVSWTCARCHTVLFSGYPYTWEGGRRDRDPGGSSINSGEARDFLLGHCASQMTCTACHDPHALDRTEKLARIARPEGNGVCTSCHAELAGAGPLRAHAHHAPDGEAGACVACHMAKKNLHLGYRLTRYHRIGSPTDEERVLRDRPLECALCHADKTVNELVGTMERWWGKRYDRAALRALYGADLDVNALDATLARGRPHEQATAIGVLGERKRRDAVPALAAQLAHAIPLVRFFARHSLEEITGRPVDVDVNQPAAQVTAEARRWLESAAAR